MSKFFCYNNKKSNFGQKPTPFCQQNESYFQNFVENIQQRH